MIRFTQAVENCVILAAKSVEQKVGGPFGAFIYEEGDGLEDDDMYVNVIAYGVNRVLTDNDPTAHAEIVAIREACKRLGTYDLKGYCIYATGYPCPMCMSAINWANIKRIMYSQTLEDAENVGFQDKELYTKFASLELDNLEEFKGMIITQEPNKSLKDLYSQYKETGEIY